MTAKEESDEIKVIGVIAARVFGSPRYEIRPIAGAGSGRRYYRIYSAGREEASLIVTAGESARENAAFIQLASLLREEGVNVPQVMGHFGQKGNPCPIDETIYYVQQDLGSLCLLEYFNESDKLEEGEKEQAIKVMMDKVWRQLVMAQTLDPRKWIAKVMAPDFGYDSILTDLHYFKFCFLKVCGVPFDEDRLEGELRHLARKVADVAQTGLMLRDFQSRNLMVRIDRNVAPEPWIIDFQGARLGPVLYDAVSFLWQSRLGLSPEVRRREMERYASIYCRRTGATKEALLASVPEIAVIRTLQVLGAYGLRGLIERKSQFIVSIEAGVRNLCELLADPRHAGSPAGWGAGEAENYPELRRVAELLSGREWGSTEKPTGQEGILTVTVMSFSYKKGYPVDFGGNGGGFIFDCRALPNPGRYEQYKLLTGMDAEVRAFLDGKVEVARFQQLTRELVGQAVDNYLDRHFTSLSVGYGCTGGRHRSVYNCEQLARWLKERYPSVRVVVEHREQRIRREEKGRI